MNHNCITVGILGASGYTGVELIRLLDRHPNVKIISLGAQQHAELPADEVFLHLPSNLPRMVNLEKMPFSDLDILFLSLPHTISARILKKIFDCYPRLRLIDLSADFRFNSPQVYQNAYGVAHPAPHLLSKSVYGLSEIYISQIKKARLVACTGCYCAAIGLALIPLLKANIIHCEGIIIDAKSGITGAGRNKKLDLAFSEVHQGANAYSVGTHRHSWEIDQEMSLAAGQQVNVTFVPHLIPINRGILTTIYVNLKLHEKIESIYQTWKEYYNNQPFIHVLKIDKLPKIQHVVGSNSVHLGVAKDRINNRCIIVSVLDNLIKGASGQAIQNMNLMFGLPQNIALDRIALYP